MQLATDNFTSDKLTTKRVTFGKTSLILTMLVGFIFLGIGGVIFQSSQIRKSWIRVNGTVVGTKTDLGTSNSSYYPVVEYSVDGQRLRATSNIGSSSSPSVGDVRQVAYDPVDPAKSKVVTTGSSLILTGIFPVIGLFLIVLSPLLYLRSSKRGQSITNLVQTGQKIAGVITDIQATGTKGESSTYKVIVTATDPSGSVRLFTSDSLTGGIGLAMASFKGQSTAVDVYVDLTDLQKYYVDISDLPSLNPGTIQQMVASLTRGKTPPDSRPADSTPPQA